jgi:hypothetical protein
MNHDDIDTHVDKTRKHFAKIALHKKAINAGKQAKEIAEIANLPESMIQAAQATAIGTVTANSNAESRFR